MYYTIPYYIPYYNIAFHTRLASRIEGFCFLDPFGGLGMNLWPLSLLRTATWSSVARGPGPAQGLGASKSASFHMGGCQTHGPFLGP